MNLLELARSALTERSGDNTAHYRWCVTLPDGSALEVCCLPELRAAEMQERYPRARLMPLPNSLNEAEQWLAKSSSVPGARAAGSTRACLHRSTYRK